MSVPSTTTVRELLLADSDGPRGPMQGTESQKEIVSEAVKNLNMAVEDFAETQDYSGTWVVNVLTRADRSFLRTHLDMGDDEIDALAAGPESDVRHTGRTSRRLRVMSHVAVEADESGSQRVVWVSDDDQEKRYELVRTMRYCPECDEQVETELLVPTDDTWPISGCPHVPDGDMPEWIRDIAESRRRILRTIDVSNPEDIHDLHGRRVENDG